MFAGILAAERGWPGWIVGRQNEVDRNRQTLRAGLLQVESSHLPIDCRGLFAGIHGEPAVVAILRFAGGDRVEKNVVHVGHIIQPPGNMMTYYNYGVM